MLTVHHLNNSRSQRVLWLLEELGVPYDIAHYQRDARTSLAPASLLKIHPLGKSPVITDGDRTVAETGAILEYILEQHGEGRLSAQPSTDEALDQRYWLHYAEGSAMPPLVMSLILNAMATKPPFFIRPIAKQLVKAANDAYVGKQISLHLGFWEQALAKSGWFVGDSLSVADIAMSFPIEAAAERIGYANKYPNLNRFLSTIHARPAYQTALEKGGPYAFA